MIHVLRQSPEDFEAVLCGRKTFEILPHSRDYREGDLLALNEYGDNRYTGRCCLVKIDYISPADKYIRDGYISMSIKPCLVEINDGKRLEYNRNVFAVPLVEKSPLREG